MKWFRRKKPNAVKKGAPEPRRYGRMFAWMASVAAVAAATVLASEYLARSDWERFRTLEINGELRHVGVEEVRDALAPHLERGFTAIDMRATRESVEALPWVFDAAVRREWPATLVVELREQRPVATWFGTALMNADGEVFIDGAAGISGPLPDVGGPRGTQREMVARLNELRAIAASGGLDLSRLLRTERRAERFWLTTDAGMEIEVRLGRRDTTARLQRFMNVAWPALQSRAAQIEYVDMRYTNGFAVGWQTANRNGDSTPGERSNVQENG